MKVYFNRIGNVDHIDCTSIEFIEIQNNSNIWMWLDLAQLPKCLGETIPERVAMYLELKKKGIILQNTEKHGRKPINRVYKMDSNKDKGTTK